MFGSRLRQELEQCSTELATNKQTLAAISKSLAMIEFSPNGDILDANEAFLNCMGYRMDEVRGQHHRMFCARELLSSIEYTRFWQRLANGETVIALCDWPRATAQSGWRQAICP